ncbi:MAG: CopG family antitoxin [Candidatus Omnitrophica bacterium]|nr:CopG family antitoxin [Candidatus Omnitrophota bacterium]
MKNKNDFYKRFKLTKEEQWYEDHAEEFVPVTGPEYDAVVAALERKKKEMVLNMRINRDDLEAIKQKARKAGIKYQTLISEILHRVAKA